MRDLNYQLKGICGDCREGSHATQAARWRDLNLFANQLHDLGFRHLSANGLKPKHIAALLKLWRSTSISTATIKNRMAHLRWWAVKIDKKGIIPLSNAFLDIPPRSYVSDVSKAIDLPPDSLELISDPFIKISIQLQLLFGLRREESLKFVPSWADRGDSITLKGSWCKGGQQRSIPIINQAQRDILDMARKLAGFGSLIPSGRSYFQHLKVYEHQTRKAGLFNLHGLRHKYAQERFLELTGCPATAASNPLPSHTNATNDSDKDNNLNNLDSSSNNPNNNPNSNSKLSPQQKSLHKLARLTISKELGHHRLQVTSVYLGKPLK